MATRTLRSLVLQIAIFTLLPRGVSVCGTMNEAPLGPPKVPKLPFS